MLRADPVMDTDQPRLEIGEDEMDDGQDRLGHFGIAAFGNGVVIVAALAQAGATALIVRDDRRPRSDGANEKSTRRFGASVRGDRQPNAPRMAPILSLVLRGSRLPMAHLNGAGDQNLVVNASTFAACPTTGPGFVHPDRLVRPATDAAWAHSFPHRPFRQSPPAQRRECERDRTLLMKTLPLVAVCVNRIGKDYH